jgi:hypothetical protein
MNSDEAERAIASILSDLETSSGQIVESIKIDDLDITSMKDSRPEWIRKVCIELKRQPGTKWDK